MAQAELAKQCAKPLFLFTTEPSCTQADSDARPPSFGECGLALLLGYPMASGNTTYFFRVRGRQQLAIGYEGPQPLEAFAIQAFAIGVFAAQQTRLSIADLHFPILLPHSHRTRRSSPSSWAVGTRISRP